MHPNAQRVQDAISSLGLSCQVIELPESTRTAAEAAAAVGATLAQIVKSLIFLAGDEPILVLASGANRVSMAKLRTLLGKAVSRAGADAVKATTGFPIGGVAPAGLKQPMHVLIDEDLCAYAELWAAAGTPHAVFRCSPKELIQISGGDVADVKEEPSPG
jgi:prolyl-tRNA editing enzyme YbaK/EbsC (Cys-tRNA(Pro) deacylase)